MRKIHFVIAFLCSTFAFSQLHHQMISSQGTTSTNNEGIIVTQTIGQQSVIGNSQVSGLAFGQGFQQSIWTRLINTNNENFSADYYPNPFIDYVTFNFTNMSDETILISIFDVAGKQVYSTSKEVSDNKLILNLGNLSNGSYLVRLYNKKKTFYTKLIKK